MLQNAYFLAKIGADTAENKQHFAEICQKLATTLRVRRAPHRERAGGQRRAHVLVPEGLPLLRRAARVQGAAEVVAGLCFFQSSSSCFRTFQTLLLANVWQTLRGPFSAVSTPNFASKYLFESSSRDLQDLHTSAHKD